MNSSSANEVLLLVREVILVLKTAQNAKRPLYKREVNLILEKFARIDFLCNKTHSIEESLSGKVSKFVVRNGVGLIIKAFWDWLNENTEFMK
jgi:hypothetical protein